MWRLIIFSVTGLLLFLVGWSIAYPSSSDPKNIRYVLWKAGLYEKAPEMATDAMVGDRNRDKLVVGKSKAQLRDQFGSLLTPVEVSSYLNSCYQASPWKGKDVLFIRRSSWMVVFHNDKATNLILIKGC